MTEAETRAVLTVAVLAAFADGAKHEREREAIRRIAQGLSQEAGVALPTLVQDVLMQRVTLQTAVPGLASQTSRQLAYEMAVGVCDADGAQSPAEQAFLAQLRDSLRLDPQQAAAVLQDAESLAQVPLSSGSAAIATGNQAAAAGVATALAAQAPATAGSAAKPTPDEAALDKDILDAAIMNGALELLPESLSTLAIIPLQMKLVYRIGQAHGYELDSGHVKDFLATAGVGLTSQYLEQAGRKLLGGLLRSVGGGGVIGGVLGGLGRQAVSSGMSFAATYALGHVAKRYYAGGRTLSTQMLKDTYASIAQQAQTVYSQHLPAIQEKARHLDAGKVLAMVRSR